MEVNTELSHLICEATFLPYKQADLRDPRKKDPLQTSRISFSV